MGLPLFVAPVETDLPLKDAPKRDVLSPSRSAIRRAAQAELRDRRNPNRPATVRILAMPPHHMSTATTRDPSEENPERTRASPGDAVSRSSASRREALREVVREVASRTERPQRQRLEEQMSSIFGGTWHSVSPLPSRREEDGPQEADFWGWSSDVRPRARRARIVAPDLPRRNRSPQRRRYHIGSPPFRPTPDGSERPQSESASTDDTAQPVPFSPYRSLRRNQARMFRALMSRHPLTNPHPLARRIPPDGFIDGLGDRDRSVSPEVWETLLTTLTPDPQPPSAGSSFASAAATQNAGPSNAPPSAPDLPDEMMDPACDSGHENSDDDEAYYAYPGSRNPTRQEARRQRLSQPVPDYNLDGPSDGAYPPWPEHPAATGPGRQSPGRFQTNAYSALANNAWTGRLSHGGSEDERAADQSQPAREESGGSGPAAAQTGDEEWLGMQRIVRNLAAREDIPDEWWAEAGLNRTLPQDEPN